MRLGNRNRESMLSLVTFLAEATRSGRIIVAEHQSPEGRGHSRHAPEDDRKSHSTIANPNFVDLLRFILAFDR
jgi:hypothetical protein